MAEVIINIFFLIVLIGAGIAIGIILIGIALCIISWLIEKTM